MENLYAKYQIEKRIAMIDRKNLVGGDLSPIDIHSEEFKKRCEARRKKRKEQGYLIITNDKRYENITRDELRELFKGGRVVSIDCEE